ncbi:hypothetical protein F5884DRAFT_814747 [Xylogone sp. PMI_703]|nr:hypothetical protein F5884DRAFT_814747 [Xylogone sp. PMI_703]
MKEEKRKDLEKEIWSLILCAIILNVTYGVRGARRLFWMCSGNRLILCYKRTSPSFLCPSCFVGCPDVAGHLLPQRSRLASTIRLHLVTIIYQQLLVLYLANKYNKSVNRSRSISVTTGGPMRDSLNAPLIGLSRPPLAR